MTEFINYLVCFAFGVITGFCMVSTMVIIIIKEKAPNRGP